jgi:hypothetical protein
MNWESRSEPTRIEWNDIGFCCHCSIATDFPMEIHRRVAVVQQPQMEIIEERSLRNVLEKFF